MSQSINQYPVVNHGATKVLTTLMETCADRLESLAAVLAAL
jgi:hypothetical protein